MAEIKRHEIKYIISLREAELLKYRLRALLRPDSHVRADGSYFIRSLYFDEEGSRFPDRLRQMLEIYFAERGASLYLNDDAFFEAYAQLNEIARRLQAVRNGRSGTDGAQG